MRRIVAGVTVGLIGGLLTYEAIALALSFVALVIACYVLWRQTRWEQNQTLREVDLQKRADALGAQMRDDLAGG